MEFDLEERLKVGEEKIKFIEEKINNLQKGDASNELGN